MLEQESYELLVISRLGQGDVERIRTAWLDSRRELLSGQPAIRDGWGFLPIDRPPRGLVYLGGATGLTFNVAMDLVAELGRLFELALSVRDRETESMLLHHVALQTLPMQRLSRDRLQLVMRSCDYNISRAAGRLGVTRATMYKWLGRHRLLQDCRQRRAMRRGDAGAEPAPARAATPAVIVRPTNQEPPLKILRRASAPDPGERHQRVCPTHASVLWIRGDTLVCPKGHVAKTWNVV